MMCEQGYQPMGPPVDPAELKPPRDGGTDSQLYIKCPKCNDLIPLEVQGAFVICCSDKCLAEIELYWSMSIGYKISGPFITKVTLPPHFPHGISNDPNSS